MLVLSSTSSYRNRRSDQGPSIQRRRMGARDPALVVMLLVLGEILEVVAVLVAVLGKSSRKKKKKKKKW